MPPRAGAVASASAETAPTQRDRHLRMIAERGRTVWQKARGYNLRAKVEASIGRYKRVIGDALRSRTDRSEATEVAIAAAALNRMLAFGRPKYVRIWTEILASQRSMPTLADSRMTPELAAVPVDTG